MISEDAKSIRTWLDMQRPDGGGSVEITQGGMNALVSALDALIDLSIELEALGVGGRVSLTAEHLNGENIVQFPLVPRPVPQSPEGGAA